MSAYVFLSSGPPHNDEFLQWGDIPNQTVVVYEPQAKLWMIGGGALLGFFFVYLNRNIAERVSKIRRLVKNMDGKNREKEF